MEYLEPDQVDRIQQNNDLLSGEFVRRDNQRAIAKVKQTAKEINQAIKPFRSPTSFTQAVVEGATGKSIEHFIANDGVGSMVKKRNVHRNIENRIKRLFRRR